MLPACMKQRVRLRGTIHRYVKASKYGFVRGARHFNGELLLGCWCLIGGVLTEHLRL